MKLAIITGTTKGLGEALKNQFMQMGYTVIGIARSQDIKNPHHIKANLNHVPSTLSKLEKKLKEFKLSQIKSLVLINNAGIINPISPINKINFKDLEENFKVNFFTPFMFTQLFIKLNVKPQIKTIININSGASKFSIHGWSAYCSSKASLSMLSECTKNENPKINVINFSPGIIDTPMQAQIRATKKTDFKEVDRFKKYKKENNLLAPEIAAEKLVQLIKSKNVNKKTIHFDVSEL